MRSLTVAAYRHLQTEGLQARGCRIAANATGFELAIDDVLTSAVSYPTTPNMAMWQRAILDFFRIVYTTRWQPLRESEYM